MNLDEFSKQIEALRERVAALLKRTGSEPEFQPELLTEAFEERQIALEERKVAESELEQQNLALCKQNEDLRTVHQVLLAERQRYQELFEFAPDAYLVTDTNGVITEANRTATTLFNISQSFLVGEPLDIYVVETEQQSFRSLLTELGRLSGVQEFEVCLLRRNITPISAAVTVAAVRNHEGSLVALRWLMRDITERKQLDNLVREQVEELEKLSQLKDDFLRTVSHELRTPLSNMKMSIDMLEIALNQLGPEAVSPDGKATRYLEILRVQCEREISLINDLLDLQRLEVGGIPLNPKPIHLQTWLPQVIKPFEERTTTRQLKLQLDILPSLPPLVCDLSSLERILAELLNNACKYTPPGERVTVAAWAIGGRIQFRVSNSGVEIPQSELSRIFDNFYRIISTDRWDQGGTGLGLTLVKKLTEHLGGTLQVTSEHGLTTFTVDVPVSSFPPEPLKATASSPPARSTCTKATIPARPPIN